MFFKFHFDKLLQPNFVAAKKLFLASIIIQCVTGKTTTTAINHGIDLHGLSHYQDFVSAFQIAGLITSYADMLVLYDVFGLKDVSESMFIPQKMLKYVSIVCIVNNNEFNIGTPTGNS